MRCFDQHPSRSEALIWIPSALEKKLRRKLKKASLKAARSGVRGLTAMHPVSRGLQYVGAPPNVANMVDKAVNRKVNKAMSNVGKGAYGRGAYGRGAYGDPGGEPAVNSLFVEYDKRRQSLGHHPDETGRISVSRREYVMRVIAPTSPGEFNNTSFSINPGLTGVFAWLSQIAANYDEYSLRHLVFNYKPVISKASQSGSMGSIVLAANYNAGASKFASFREMAEYMGAMEFRICDEGWFGVECDPKKHGSQEIEYVRTGAVPQGQDIKTYDLGTFQLATSDVDATSYPAGTLLGHLYVEYDVTLGKPKLFAALGKTIPMDMYRGMGSYSIAAPTANAIAARSNNLETTLADDGTITFPDNATGTYMIKVFLKGNLIDVDDNATLGSPTTTTELPVLREQGDQTDENTWNASNQGIMIRIVSLVPPPAGLHNSVQLIVASATNIYGFSVIITQVRPDIEW